ncbi:MAG: hypothetical protein QOE65_1936 [Solirubrobacteraceae bacterium]|jgi:hypothetical protein|nr:hypothetical protein [Solirubrobacteraceae bacterium]
MAEARCPGCGRDSAVVSGLCANCGRPRTKSGLARIPAVRRPTRLLGGDGAGVSWSLTLVPSAVIAVIVLAALGIELWLVVLVALVAAGLVALVISASGSS